MAKAELIASFDYESVEKESKGKLIALAGQIKRHGNDLIKSVVEIGEAIHLANDLLSVGRAGQFKAWVESETGLSSTTAYEWMAVYRRSLNFPIIGKFPPTVAYLLSPESVPDAAIKDFEKQVDKGTRPTVAAAKATLARFKDVADKPARTKSPTKVRSQSDEPSNGRPDEPPVPPPPPVNEDSEPEEVTLEYRMTEWNKQVEDLARAVSTCLDDAPTGPWLGEGDDDNRLGIAKTQLKSAAATIRLAKCPHVCCKCDGKGCKACRQSGMMPKNTWEMMGGAK